VTIADDTLTVGGPGGLTEMACPGLMKWDEGVFTVFTDTLTFEVSDSGDALTLTSDNGDSIAFARADR
jgi:heat shock protein HslJ